MVSTWDGCNVLDTHSSSISEWITVHIGMYCIRVVIFPWGFRVGPELSRQNSSSPSDFSSLMEIRKRWQFESLELDLAEVGILSLCS